MSGTTTISEEKSAVYRYLWIEHGTEKVTLTMCDSRYVSIPLMFSREHLLSPTECRALAAELTRRADLIEGKK